MIKTLIVVNISIDGIHTWLDAEKQLSEVAFLSYPHMHQFKIQVKKEVETGNNDRQIEIISFKHELEDYVKRCFYDKSLKCCDFGNRSCEVIAKDLMEAYNLDFVQVLEDGYFGAEIHK